MAAIRARRVGRAVGAIKRADVDAGGELSRTVGAHFRGAHQTFVEFLNTPHGVYEYSAVRTPGALPCGTQVLLSFLADPAATPDTRCLADMKPLDFHGSTELAQAAFGTAELWEN